MKIAVQFLPEAIEFTHKFAGGIYTRFARIAPGVAMIGKKHRQKNIFHLSKGEMLLWDKKNGWRKIVAPFTEVVLPGAQRAALSLTEIEGSNIFETDADTPEKADAKLFEPFVMRGKIGKLFKQLTQKNDVCGMEQI